MVRVRRQSISQPSGIGWRRLALATAAFMLVTVASCAPSPMEESEAEPSADMAQDASTDAATAPGEESDAGEAPQASDDMAESADNAGTDDSTAAADQPAPVPDIATGVRIPQETGYYVEEVADGLYWLTEGSYTMMFLTTGEGVIVVDAPPSIGENILAAISDVTDEPITHVVYSHSHADHIGAAGLYPEEATVVAHSATADQLERSMGPDEPFPYGAFVGGGAVPIPDTVFDDSMTLEVGSQVLQLDYHGINHEPGNIFIYAPNQKVLMLVDVVFPGWVPFKDLALAEDIPGFFEAHDQVLAYDFEHLVAGHLNRLGTRDDVETQQKYLADVRTAAANALAEVDFMAIGQEVGFGNAWVLFDTYLDAVAQTCADEVESEWVGQLGGADIFTFDHCFKTMESLRID